MMWCYGDGGQDGTWLLFTETRSRGPGHVMYTWFWDAWFYLPSPLIKGRDTLLAHMTSDSVIHDPIHRVPHRRAGTRHTHMWFMILTCILYSVRYMLSSEPSARSVLCLICVSICTICKFCIPSGTWFHLNILNALYFVWRMTTRVHSVFSVPLRTCDPWFVK